jgi:hypothetical protein
MECWSSQVPVRGGMLLELPMLRSAVDMLYGQSRRP